MHFTTLARTWDLIPVDFFQGSFCKSKVYANNPKTIDELKNVIATIDEFESRYKL